MDKFKLWREQYSERKYLNHLNKNDLDQRAVDIINNITFLNEDCKISIDNTPKGEFLLMLWTHVLEEYYSRYGSYTKGFEIDGFSSLLKNSFIDPRTLESQKATKFVKNTKPNTSNIIYKYGKYEYLEKSYNDGSFRIAPASFYNDPSLNYAVQDDELSFILQPNPNEVILEVTDGRTGKNKGTIDLADNKLKICSLTNYFVFCLSYTYSPKMFVDFEADSCLVIKNCEKFLLSLANQFKMLFPECKVLGKNVSYSDPLNTDTNKVDIFFIKHFRFMYQKEFRIVWIPKSNIQNLEPKFINIPDIKSYCELKKIT